MYIYIYIYKICVRKELAFLLLNKLKQIKKRFNKFRKNQDIIENYNSEMSKDTTTEPTSKDSKEGETDSVKTEKTISRSGSSSSNSSVYNNITIYTHNAINNNIKIVKDQETGANINVNKTNPLIEKNISKHTQITNLKRKLKDCEKENYELNAKVQELENKLKNNS